MATIKDVAKLAGVSVATVSRVLNDSPSVIPKTREIVLGAIEQLNYKPNLLGRNLRRSQTKNILVLLPTISNPFYSKIVKGMEDVAHNEGYQIMICTTGSNIGREETYINLLSNKLVDGVIFLAPEINANQLSEINKLFPIIQCCEYKMGAKVPCVSIDNEKAAYDAVNHLISIGHKRIGMISSKNHFMSTIKRERGYKKALEDAGIFFDIGYIKYGDYGFKSGFDAMQQFLKMNPPPTAIFSISDLMAIGAISTIEKNDLSVPGDIAVVGFDNISFSSIYKPRLTTVSQPQKELGKTAMELLLKRIISKIENNEHVILDHELLIRESTILSD